MKFPIVQATLEKKKFDDLHTWLVLEKFLNEGTQADGRLCFSKKHLIVSGAEFLVWHDFTNVWACSVTPGREPFETQYVITGEYEMRRLMRNYGNWKKEQLPEIEP